MDVYSKVLQPFVTAKAACPRRDMIRIWPLPVVDPWFEDWWEKLEEKDKWVIRNMGYENKQFLIHYTKEHVTYLY